jgi:hypothetical protein
VSSSWVLPTERLPAANAVIDAAAVEVGRSPREIRRGYIIEGDFTARCGFLKGPPAVWVEQLTELTLEQGISTYLLGRVGSADVIRRFAAEVAPAVRAAVNAERPTGDVQSPETPTSLTANQGKRRQLDERDASNPK